MDINLALREIISSDEDLIYFRSLLFYKHLSDQLKSYFNSLIEKEDLLLSEAYEKHYDKFKKDALSKFGYFIEYDYLFENIFIGESILDKLDKALKEIATSSKESIFYFDNVNLSNPVLGKTKSDKELKITTILVVICSLSKNYPIDEIFDESLKFKSKTYINSEDYINELISQIAISNNKEANTIYDPFIGGAMSILNLYNHLNEPTIYGQEIDSTMYNLAIMNLIIHGVNYNKLNMILDDTINNPGFLGELFNIIISIPPFGAKHNVVNMECVERFQDVKINKKIRHSEFFYIMHMLYYLDKEGVIVTIVPPGVLFRIFDLAIKHKIIKENNYLDAIINLPSNIFNSTSINTVLLVFRKDRNNENVLFVDASKEFEPQRRTNILKEEHIEKIVKTYRDKVEIDKFSRLVNVSEIESNEFNLSVSRYIDTYEEEYVKLEDVILKQASLNNKLAEINQKIEELMFRIGDGN